MRFLRAVCCQQRSGGGVKHVRAHSSSTPEFALYKSWPDQSLLPFNTHLSKLCSDLSRPLSSFASLQQPLRHVPPRSPQAHRRLRRSPHSRRLHHVQVRLDTGRRRKLQGVASCKQRGSSRPCLIARAGAKDADVYARLWSSGGGNGRLRGLARRRKDRLNQDLRAIQERSCTRHVGTLPFTLPAVFFPGSPSSSPLFNFDSPVADLEFLSSLPTRHLKASPFLKFISAYGDKVEACGLASSEFSSSQWKSMELTFATLGHLCFVLTAWTSSTLLPSKRFRPYFSFARIMNWRPIRTLDPLLISPCVRTPAHFLGGSRSGCRVTLLDTSPKLCGWRCTQKEAFTGQGFIKK